MAVFDEKFNLPQSKIFDYLRYQELFLKTSRTSAEEVEFQNLQNELKPYLIEASDWNQLTNYVGKPDYSPLLTQNSSVFSLGAGKDEQGQDVDVSSSVTEGQVSVELSGRTYTNLLGSNGDCENLNYFNYAWYASVTNTSDSVFGNNAIKVRATSDVEEHYQGKENYIPTEEGKYYFVSGYCKVNSGLGEIRVINGASSTVRFTNVGIWERKGYKIRPNGNIGIRLQVLDDSGNRIFAGNGENAIFDGVMLVEITLDEFNNLTVDELLEKYPYINDIKSTVSTRLKVVGKNLVRNGNGEEGLNYWYDSLNATGTWDTNEKAFKVVSAVNGDVVSDFLKISPSKQYTISAKVKSDGVNGSFVAVQWYDKAGNFISSTEGNRVTSTTYATSTELATPPKNAVIAKISLFNTNAHTAYFKEVQLEQGDTATSYEPYKESIRYYTLPDGVDGLHSLPNDTKDEVTDSGKLIQRTKKYVLQASDIVTVLNSGTDTTIAITNEITDMITQTNSIDGSTRIEGWIEGINTDNSDSTNANRVYYTYSTDKKIRFILPYGTTLTDAQNILAGTTLIYQLRQDQDSVKTYELNTTPLTAFENGTIIIEPVIKFEMKPTAGVITIPQTDYPINFVESVKEINIDESGSRTYIDVDYTHDDTTITITNADDTKLYQVVYHYPQELTTIPESAISYVMNTKGQIVNNNSAIQQLSKHIKELDSFTTAYLLNLETRVTALESV